uniref:NADH-ubiquinone oxidoreductase chain 2 n=1 Tax=Cnemaspis kivulegedarai TaxID=2596626 RepID=A0A7D0H3I8_9SAUR|nr:NADH dehydrogenase subunit 2 [Cnemaspis kivulegedarai]QDP16548.1 NADH dehydrogenase subunit 2 [Cnemaspis kivulegedarai]QDP16549.1 NADH dehydrogenase subunit 2 [Cnemaspis kivulegedarai]
MSPTVLALLFTALTTSTMAVMLSHHWLFAWLALELNTLTILPIIIKHHHPRATEAATKYFLIQATAAATLLLAGTMNAWQTGQWNITHTTTPHAAMLFTMAIMMKLGLAPMHLWYPEILQGTTMLTALLISTWQKIAPLTLLFLTAPTLPSNTLMLSGLLSALLGGWAGLNQTQTRKIMAFSSIAHMGWLITTICLNPSLTMLAFILYAIMTTTMFITLNTNTTNSLANLNTTWSYSPTMLTMMVLTLLALGGLPPLTGFMPKWLILKELVTVDLIALSTALALASLPSLFFYTRMAYLTTLTLAPAPTSIKHKWRFKTQHPQNHAMLITMTTLLLPLTPLLHTT